MADWVDVPIDTKLFQNIEEEQLTRAFAALENSFVNEAGGMTRFPGIKPFVTLPNKRRVYIHDWRGDMMAVAGAQLFRIDEAGTIETIPGAPISGSGRVLFSKTPDALLMAAGKQIVRFAGIETEILSEDAPDATHVTSLDGFVIANEVGTGRFAHSNAGNSRKWDALDIFAANAKPDNVTTIITTDFRELIVAGPDSIEQYERLSSGTIPFFRRWAVGEGIKVPYSVLFTDNATWAVNSAKEFVRLSGQSSLPQSDDIGLQLEKVDDWTDAWVGGYPNKPLNIIGQKFIVLQIPNATNPYGTKGLTFLYDYRADKWGTLYGWDATLSLPARWPVWSHWPVFDKMYVGGDNGKIGELTDDTYQNFSDLQRMLGRTAFLSELGEIRIDDLKMRVKRGVGTNVTDPEITLRVNRDNRGFGRWKTKGLGKAGQRHMTPHFGTLGIADTWQFEWVITDDAPVEISYIQALVTPVGRGRG